ncbi:hypothetical protein E2320_014658, partial [Naja naja]
MAVKNLGDICHLKELAQNIGHNQPSLDFSWLFSWLPDFHWLKIPIASIVTVCVLGALLCCLCHCILPCLSCLKICSPAHFQPSIPEKQDHLMVVQIDHKHQVYLDMILGVGDSEESHR